MFGGGRRAYIVGYYEINARANDKNDRDEINATKLKTMDSSNER